MNREGLKRDSARHAKVVQQLLGFLLVLVVAIKPGISGLRIQGVCFFGIFMLFNPIKCETLS